jgi:hypothetical protein
MDGSVVLLLNSSVVDLFDIEAHQHYHSYQARCYSRLLASHHHALRDSFVSGAYLRHGRCGLVSALSPFVYALPFAKT